MLRILSTSTISMPMAMIIVPFLLLMTGRL